MKRTRGFTLIELLVVIAIIALLIGLLLPALAQAKKNADSLKDSTQIKQVHQAFIVFAESHQGRLPVPGLIDRLADPNLGEQPAVGPEDFAQNTTARLYSAAIAQNFFGPDIVVGATENNPFIVAKEDYNYDQYNPAVNDTYWDDSFLCNLAGETNCSYAHMALCGQRKKVHWKNSQEGNVPGVGTRGTGPGGGATFGGAVTGNEYSASPTLALHGSAKEWDGYVAYMDNHTSKALSFYPDESSYYMDFSFIKDNIFDAEFNDYAPTGQAGADNYLVMSTQAQENSCTATFDALNQ